MLKKIKSWAERNNYRFDQRRKLMRYENDFKEYVTQLRNGSDKRLETSDILRFGDHFVESKEYFTHYDAFAKYAFEEVWKFNKTSDKTPRIFDVGSTKAFLSILSVFCEVEALNLNDPLDYHTSVKYTKGDISEYNPRLNPKAGSYDFITSFASFHLLGLGRYGDKINPAAQSKFVELCDTLLAPGGKVIFSFSFGKDQLLFNNGWVFSLETIKNFFSNFKIIDVLVDRNSYGTLNFDQDPGKRFIRLNCEGENINYHYRDFKTEKIPYDIAFIVLEKSFLNK